MLIEQPDHYRTAQVSKGLGITEVKTLNQTNQGTQNRDAVLVAEKKFLLLVNLR